MLHAKPADLIAKAKGFTAELKEARQNVERMKEKILHSDVDRFLYASKNIGGIKVITTTRTDLEAGDLRKLGDFLRDKDPDTVAVLATATESKVTFVAVCGKNAVARGIRAGDLVRAVSAVTGGKGAGLRHGRRQRGVEDRRRAGHRGRFCGGKAGTIRRFHYERLPVL